MQIFKIFPSVFYYLILHTFHIYATATSSLHDSIVAVSAWKTRTQDVIIGGTVIFDGIFVNEGNAYQPLTGRFTCPVNGVYYVSLSAQSSGSDLDLKVTRDRAGILQVRDQLTRHAYNSGLVQCDAESVIAVTGGTYSEGILGDPTIPYTVFTVILITTDSIGYRSLHTDVQGFTAFSNYKQEYEPGRRITFNETIFNDDADYNPILSTYTCPVSGYYLVSATALQYYTDGLNIGIKQGLTTIASISANFGQDVQISNSVIVQCPAGEVLSVRSTAEGSLGAYSLQDPNERITTFTAMLFAENATYLSENYHDSFIGCSLWKKNSQSYENGDNVVFEGSALNVGDHCNPALGRFVCPVSGIYFVEASATKEANSVLQVNVLYSTVTLFRLEHISSSSTYDYTSVTSSAIVRCFSGEDIRMKGAGTGSIFGNDNNRYTTFNVALLYQY